MRLTDGTIVRCISGSEARVLDSHVAGYFEHGAEFPEDSVIFDVGANIGLFGVRMIQRLSHARVFAFEPVPAIHAVCTSNAERLGSGRMKVFGYGLSSTPGRCTFTYYPRCPALSTGHPEDWERPGAFLDAVRGSLTAAGRVTRLARLVPPFLAPLVARYLTSKHERVEADLRTISQVIAEHDLARIELLKIDCEGAELEVLRGIEPRDWPRVQQVVVEVHDLDGRLDAVRSLLRREGLDRITVSREDGFEATRLYNLFARRPPA